MIGRVWVRNGQKHWNVPEWGRKQTSLRYSMASVTFLRSKVDRKVWVGDIFSVLITFCSFLLIRDCQLAAPVVGFKECVLG